MRRIVSIYLAGPDVGHPDAVGLIARKRALCSAAGYTPLTPDPEALLAEEQTEVDARRIYADRLTRLKESDAVIADLTPFRGPNCDPAVAFEAGVMAGLVKPVFAYMNVRTEEDAELLARIDDYEGASAEDEGVWRDSSGYLIEDYGLPESLMLWGEARRLFVIVTAEPDSDLTGLQLCLEAIKLYSD
jgi:nucleoside 2-deoxyribosyltransferase